MKKNKPSLGGYLNDQRARIDRSLRWVENLSKQLYPTSSHRQISNTYLKQIENDDFSNVHPLKLQTLAEIYKVDYMYLMNIAGYVRDSDLGDEIYSKIKMLDKEQQASILTTIELMLKK